MESDRYSSSDSENDIIESDKSKRKKKFKYKLGNFILLDYFIYIIVKQNFGLRTCLNRINYNMTGHK